MGGRVGGWVVGSFVRSFVRRLGVCIVPRFNFSLPWHAAPARKVAEGAWRERWPAITYKYFSCLGRCVNVNLQTVLTPLPLFCPLSLLDKPHGSTFAFFPFVGFTLPTCLVSCWARPKRSAWKARIYCPDAFSTVDVERNVWNIGEIYVFLRKRGIL